MPEYHETMTSSFRPRLAALALASLTFLGGCASLAPKYERPAAPVPEQLGEAAAEAPAVPVADLGWQAFFTDARLQQAIALALQNNRDLRIAALNIERARGLYGVQSADALPAVGVAAGETAQRVPGDLSTTGQGRVTRQYSATLGFSAYELDLFGRVRSLREASLQQVFSTEAARRTTHIGLVSQVAGSWLTLAADRARLELAQATLKSQGDTLRLTERRHELGVSSDLDVQRARTTVETARADAARYAGQVQADLQALQLLLGTPLPPALMPGSEATALGFAPLPAGLTSEVLLQRPDVMQAERDLQAANATIGAARAAFFPRISLTASVGTASSSLSGLFGAGSGIWSFVPQLALPIFDQGRNRSNLQVAQADRDIRVAAYERSIQAAFREVADGLSQRQSLVEQLAAQQALEDAASRAQFLSQARFERGVDDFLSVLDAQRSLYAAQQGRLSTALAQQLNAVTLYKALGGGWEAATRTAEAGDTPAAAAR
ncbi:efflux transporter outer membrane subunit [Azohydromonas australica]|uniref:efflux transporter outer membrane subunit n=1 Tax=Azohydromonas australica TaxID=364039 RepID=UPI0028736F96|nr:efflux transporter outer membrane subunit [Azohydromonas australica]